MYMTERMFLRWHKNYWVDKKVMRNFFKMFCKVAAIVLNFDLFMTWVHIKCSFK